MRVQRANGIKFDFEPRLLTEMFDATVARHGARPAVNFLGRITSYDELARSVARAAAGLQALGVMRGSRVALCLPNITYYPILFLATLRAGGIVVNVNPLYSQHELYRLLADSGAEIVATCDVPDIHARVSSVAAQLGLRHVITCPIAGALSQGKSLAYRLFKRREIARPPRDGRHLTYARLVAGRASATPVTVRPDAAALLQYTGGTTGTLQAAMLSHANLVANAEAIVVHQGGERPGQDRVLGVIPLFHVFALTTVLNFAIRVGGEMILLPRFDRNLILKTLERTRPTFFPAVPTIFSVLSDVARKHPVDLSGCNCVSGGAPLPLKVGPAFEQATGAKLIEGYGLSETSPIITCNPIDGVNKRGSVGPPFPGTTIEIRDRKDPTRLLPAGKNGEICVRGPQVMKGYWHRPRASAAIRVDGMLRTGDVGHLDKDGYLYIVDRIKDVILTGGYSVYPRMIEDALYEHPAVAEAVVIGVPDAYRGQIPKAFVTLLPGHHATRAELHDFLRDRVSKIEFPREVEIRKTLPKMLIAKLSGREGTGRGRPGQGRNSGRGDGVAGQTGALG